MVRFCRQARSAAASIVPGLLLAAVVAGCAARPGPEALATVSAPEGSKLVKIFVATNRARETPESNIFTTRKAQMLNFAEFTIAVPENHRDGRIELLGTSAQTKFVVVDQHALTGASFLDRLGRLAGKKRQDVTIFVHGFNNNFQESLFRLAQVSADSGIDTAQILFSWPSHARVTGYVADKESVTYSRDYLAALLTGLAADPRIGRIRLAAHSMGAWLAVETLRQLRLARKDAVIRRIDVVLAAPDVDVEVFSQQLKVVGPLSPPMKILVAKDDRALELSGFLASSIRRVGALDVEDPRVKEAVLRARVQVIDISELSSSDGLGHDRFVYLAGLYPRLAHRPGLSHAGVFLLDTAGALVTAPVHAGILQAGPD